jgi:hypothetical protein
MVEYHLPPTNFHLPPSQTAFASAEEKGKYVTQVLDVATKAVAQADFNWGQFLFAQAHAEYLVSLEGYMGLLKITLDDPAFQQYLKGQMNYLLDKVNLLLATYVGLQV